ncbi:starch synthase 4/amyloplastic [Salix suchowensis]|nr:starch synthase 4/amyloplastic [Salix suchowensis]
MATKLSTYFLSHRLTTALNCNTITANTTNDPKHQISSQYKRRQMNKSSSTEDSESHHPQPQPQPPPPSVLSVVPDDETGASVHVDSETSTSVDVEPIEQLTEAQNSQRLTVSPEAKALAIDVNVEEDEEHSSASDEMKQLAVNMGGGEKLSNIQPEDLIGMIRNAEKNTLLLNKARVYALDDLERIFHEKDKLQGEINVLERRLAENDAKMKVAAQEKIRVELLEAQLEKLRNELAESGATERSVSDLFESQNNVFNNEASLLQNNTLLQNSSVHSLSEELGLLRTENMSLKNDIEALRAELSNVKNTDERVVTLVKQHSSMKSSLQDLESKLIASQEEVSKLSGLKVECKDLWEKVDTLQVLLDKATKRADQAILVLQQNQDLRKKVDKLEESLEKAVVYKLSSEKLQQYNELMQQKMKLLEEHLQRSDEEIHSYVQLYQDSVQEFQDALKSLKEESSKRALDEPVDDMPWEFWSHLLLIIDGWLLEKKISTDDAKLLREMVWKRDGRICEAYMESREKKEREALARFLKLTSSPKSSGLSIIHIAAEMAPVAKVGGLGDVVTGLCKALQKRGHLVEIVLPKYDCMQYDRIHNLRVLDVVLESYFDGKLYKNKIWVGTVEGLPVYFIEPQHPEKFFWRGQFYGEHDDFRRFSFFSRAALELLLQSGKKPDIIHCHDWQTAFVAPLYWDIYAPKGLNSARICFTCHNFEYQGTAPGSELASCGLDVHQMNRPDRMQDNSALDRVNPVKGAVVFSNIVTTVSPTYAQEVRTAEGGKGLHSTLSFHSKKFVGILNGIDADAWNPATDTFLKVQYNVNDLQGKIENKIALRKFLGLSNADVKQPMVGCITRLVPQKGVHLIRHAIYRTLELGGQFVLLGSSPVAHIQREFEGIANHFINHDDIRLILKYDESLSHSIFAASDIFIIPSIFEPCGLTQMIAMRYGSIPVARKTGGLNDSVFDVDDDTVPLQFQNGFTFLTPDEHGVNSALDRAFNYYRNNTEVWQQLVQKDMNMDFSWELSATQYENFT